MAKILRAVAVALTAALLLGFGYAMLSSGSGPEEFQRARQALREAKSWKLTFTGISAGQSNMTAEISCPDAHAIRKSVLEVPAGAFDYVEYIVKDGVAYRRTEPATAWQIVDAAFGFEYVCSQIHKGAESPGLLPPFLSYIQAARMQIERGEEKEIDGESCRVWRVVPLLQAEESRKEEVCLGEDGLPRERIASYGYWRYKDWNHPITIAAPANVKATEPE